MAKRSHPPPLPPAELKTEDVDSIVNVVGPATNANIHGAVIEISPVKKSKGLKKRLFFDGGFADETAKLRLVGFDSIQQKQLEEYHEKQVAVQIQNCEIKKSKYCDGYDLLLGSKSRIRLSDRDIDAAAIISDHYIPPEETPVIRKWK